MSCLKRKKKITSFALTCFLTVSWLFSGTGLPVTHAKENPANANSQGKIATLNEFKDYSVKIKNKKKKTYVEGELLVKFKKHSNNEAIIKKHGLKMKEKLSSGIALLQVPKTQKVSSVINSLSKESSVEYAQPNYIYYPTSVSNDPEFGNLWGLNNTGQPILGITGKSDVDINVPEAWNLIKDKQLNNELNDVVVAVIDTGVQTTHPDLQGHIWVNEKEANGIEGVDDDGNGLVDDIHGYDFFHDDGTVYDEADGDEHGTHVAGTIAASIGNNEGVAGIAPNVKIMSLKFLGPDGGYTSDAIKAINYAKEMGVKISNNSWGGGSYDNALKEAIEESGMLFVAAAGNDGENNDSYPAYPASYNSSNILSVAALDNKGNKAWFSNYGKTSVDIAAPGVDILSTVPVRDSETVPAFGTAAEITGPGQNYKAIFNGVGFENFSNSTQRNEAFQKAMGFLEATPNSKILLVQDDESDTGNRSYLTLYKGLLNAFGNQPTVKTVKTNADGTTGLNLSNYDVVVWFTGDAYGSINTTLTENDLSSLTTYLENGGRLLLSGQDAIFGNEMSDFVTQTLGISYLYEDVAITTVSGELETIYEGKEYAITFPVLWADRIEVNESADTDTKINLSYPEYPIDFPAYEYYDGTSMATPHVTGAAALAMGVNNNFTPEQLIDLIKKTGKPVTGASMTASGKMVDAKKLVESMTPIKLEVNELFDSSQYVKGTSEPGAKITVKDDNSNIVATGTADKAGSFSLKLMSKQSADTQLFVKSELGLRISEPMIITVVHDDVKPELKGKLTATNVSPYVEGEITEEATIKIIISQKAYTGKTDTNGKFKISVGKQAEGTEGVLEITDYADPANITTVPFTVKDGIAPVIKKVNTIYNTSNYIEGEVSEKAWVDVYTSSDNKNWTKITEESLVTDDQNKFQFELPGQLATTTKVKIVAEDKDENVSKDYLVTVVPDKKAPTLLVPAVLELDDSGSKTITGKLDEEGSVEVKVEGVSIVDPIDTNKDGSFEIMIPQQKPNAKVTFILQDVVNNKTEKTIYVKDVTKPVIESVSDVFNTSKIITGTVSERATVTASVAGKEIAKATTDADGKFTLSLKNRLATGTTIELKAKDYAKPKVLESDVVSVDVKADDVNPELESITIADNSTTVTGKVSEEAKVQLKVGDTALNKTPVATDAKGNFKITIPKQKAGTEVTVVIVDYAENTVQVMKTVEDKTAPIVLKVDPFYHQTSSVITGLVSEASTVNIYKVGADGKIEEQPFASGQTTPEGQFSITMNNSLEIKSKLAVIAQDNAGYKSSAKVITVLKDTAAPILQLSQVYNNSYSIEGSLNEQGTVKVFVGTVEKGAADTDGSNNFEITLDEPFATGTKLTIICEDIVGNKRTYTHYVKGATTNTMNKKVLEMKMMQVLGF
jgi:subtilisin family serine protease